MPVSLETFSPPRPISRAQRPPWRLARRGADRSGRGAGRGDCHNRVGGTRRGRGGAIGATLRAAKGRIALLAAAAETGGGWTTAQSTAALSDLADAALDAGLAVLLRKAAEKGRRDRRDHAAARPGSRCLRSASMAAASSTIRPTSTSSPSSIPSRGALRSGRGDEDLFAHRAAARRPDAGPRSRKAMSSAPTCGCGPIPGSTPRGDLRSMRRSPITRAAARTGSVPPGSRRGPAPATSRSARRSSPNSRPTSGASISTSRPSPTSRR